MLAAVATSMILSSADLPLDSMRDPAIWDFRSQAVSPFGAQ
jgi:hypothetical protein